LQKAYRLAQRSDFNKVYKYGKSTANRQFVLYVLRNEEVEHFRLGISVSKKIGKAVVRNRMRRLLKEIVRSLAPRIASHHDLVIVVRKAALDLSYDEMVRSVMHVCNRASILKRDA
jgi:ribonuclease P protein component